MFLFPTSFLPLATRHSPLATRHSPLGEKGCIVNICPIPSLTSALRAPNFEYQRMRLQIFEKFRVDRFNGKLFLKSEFGRRFAPNRLRFKKFWQIEKLKGEIKSAILFVFLDLFKI